MEYNVHKGDFHSMNKYLSQYNWAELLANKPIQHSYDHTFALENFQVLDMGSGILTHTQLDTCNFSFPGIYTWVITWNTWKIRVKNKNWFKNFRYKAQFYFELALIDLNDDLFIVEGMTFKMSASLVKRGKSREFGLQKLDDERF